MNAPTRSARPRLAPQYFAELAAAALVEAPNEDGVSVESRDRRQRHDDQQHRNEDQTCLCHAYTSSRHLEPEVLQSLGGAPVQPRGLRVVVDTRSPLPIHTAARWLDDSNLSNVASADASATADSSSRPCSSSERPSNSCALP